MKLGENSHLNVDVIPTGILSLDLAMGVGGFPKGRIVDVSCNIAHFFAFRNMV